MSMRLNDSHLCTIKLSLLNPLENIADCGSEFVYMAFSVYFDSMSSIVLYSDKPVDNIRLSFKSCHPKTMWLDKLEMQMKRGDSYLLIYENTMVKMLAKSYPACKAKTVDFLLEHRLRKPAGHDLFVLVTTFSNCKYKKVANLKLLVEFPEFILRFKCPKGCIQLKNTCQNFIGINFNEDNDGINEIFHNIEIELKAELFEEYEKFDSTALNDIFNSNIVFEINDCIRIPVKIAKQLSAPTKAAKDSSPLKVFPCLEIGHLDSKSFFHHCFSISSNSKTQNAEEIATIQKNNSFAIKNRIFLNDITANYKVLGSVLMIRAEQPSFQIDVSETYIAIKALNPTTVVVQMCPGNLDTHSAEDSVTLKLISFLLSVDFSSFAKDRPEKFIETDKNSVISSYFKLSEKSSTLHMNFSVEIPKSVFGIPDDLKLNIANALALTISPNGDKGKRVVMSAQVSQNATHSKISLSVNGTLDFSAESYLVSLSVDGNLVEERRIDRRVICQLYNDAIRVSKKTKQDDILERETRNVADGNKHGMKDAENSMLHIEPVSFKATSRTEMRLGFRVYSEKLDEILVKSCEDVLNSLPLSKFPNFMEISIEVVDVPSVMLSIVKPDESEVPFLALNRLSIIISKKRYELRCPDRSLFRELTSSQDHYETTQVLKRILKNNKKEIDRFLKHMPLKRLHSSMLGAPIQLQFGIDTERLREYKGTNDDEHVKVVVAESNCRRIYKILYSTARSMNIPLPNGLFTKTRRTAVDMVYSIMDRFLPKQRSLKISTKILTKVGAVLIKSKTRINVVCEPVSVFLVTPGGNMVHFRLFGLQFDGMPYENQYQIVFPFVVYSREGFLVGIAKDPNKHLSVERNVLIFRLIIVFRDERHEIEIETSNFQPFEIIVRTFDGLISDCILPSYIHVLVNRLKQVGYFRTWFIDIGNQSVEEAEKNANIDAEEMERDRKVALGQAL
ncbi:uncharacterized protein VICG_01303 [Vittaforma corneae ATCC 50505]|uniref:Uncharacterized protein n=1 Tax=Vittaforma corneae (strain ATCC 50505) TaxID=993615 RepID=L2GMG1_VITCO|nr:uncharacterized protein VICG_01303 [Vittaforma corneae ATCC 50505]ELA41670.1 hypothetical protein VICG_01303 [Vittaforma corneae ATCC 50505]